MGKPKFITFTGADDQTSIDGMAELSAIYPVEWGILFSPKRQGNGRYPSIEFIKKLCEHPSRDGMTLAAHLCGGYSRQVIENGETSIDAPLCAHFDRVQINTSDPDVDPRAIAKWAQGLRLLPILQCRNSFPADTTTFWLFDASGGRGIIPKEWPSAQGPVWRGYAGGLRPDNVADAVEQIGNLALNYWIDMETGVRDEHDRFDLDRCRAVCEAVYGVKP